MSGLDRLEKLAREASRDWHSKTPTMPLREYHGAANPSAVLDLIARVKAAEAEAKAVFQAGYDLGQERDALQARIDAVKALHVREECEKHEGCPATCAPCYETWPCPTIQALTP